MTENDRLSSGQVFGRYRIVRLIGEGGMGAVYEALHPTLKKRVAIKTLLPAHARNDEARARFLREAEAASSINHPNVVNVSDVGIEGDLPYMVMELLEGQTLGDLLAERGALPPEQAAALLLPAIAAVAAGHERGVIHRDLKPHNIFLARGRRGEVVPKVLDFGVSKLTTDDALLTGTMTVLGTAAYMSPEQARGAKRVDFSSDQYSLGLILFEMVTGTRAHPGDSALEVLHNVAMGLITPARELKPELARDLDAVLTRMLTTASAGRYPSLHDAGRALLPFADENTRVSMAGEFLAATAAVSATAAAPTSVATAASTGAQDGLAVVAKPITLEPLHDDPSPESKMGRTRVMPASADDPLSDTTLRHAAMEVATMDVRRPRWRTRAGIGVAVMAALAVVGTGLLRSSSKAPSGKAVPAPIAHQDPAHQDPPDIQAPPVAAARPPASARLVPVRTLPADAAIALDDRPPVQGHLDLVLPHDGTSHRLRVSAPGFVSKVIYFRADEPPPPEIELERAPSSGRPPRTGALPTADAVSKAPGEPHPGAARGPSKPVKAIGSASPGAHARESANPAVAVTPASGRADRASETVVGSPDVSPTPRRGANNSLIIK